jgi:O-antigen biosynthesis protein WbqP
MYLINIREVKVMYRNIKRILDFTLSLIAIIFLSPIMLILILLIKAESKGPALFKQKRAGQNGTHFTIYKFRSMRIDTPDLATDKLDDPSQYITKLGKFIRKSSLDELPQLINILKGDMSIVGPRPALYNQYELIAMREEKMVNTLKPGLTGYAQVMGRDFISDKTKVTLDEYYYQNQSFRLDLKIIFKTAKNVAVSDGIKMN